MSSVIRITRIQKTDDNYLDCTQSYFEIYNGSLAKGTEILEPASMAGNPIQLDTKNFGAVLKSEDSRIEFNDYLLSTKADGLRFMMFLGNKKEVQNNERSIYFVDTKMNFWYIKGLPNVSRNYNTDKFLIDGELLFHGARRTLVSEGNIEEYEIVPEKGGHARVVFLAFDILYGQTKPGYKSEVDAVERKPLFNSQRESPHESFVYDLGSNGGMVGFKSTNRWPTTRRRFVLEEMFLNPDSPMWKFLHLESNDNLSGTQFTVLVSPFVDIREVANASRSGLEMYEIMKKKLADSVQAQCFTVDSKYNRTPWPMFKINTDGIILNPSYGDYLIGTWSLCSNKQYKWKPVHELTVDFRLGAMIRENFFQAEIKQRDSTVQFVHDGLQAILSVHGHEHGKFKTGDIAECKFSHIDKQNSRIYFTVKKLRLDKMSPNAYLTADSVMTALDLGNSLAFIKDIVGVDRPSAIDLVLCIKNGKVRDPRSLENVLRAVGEDKVKQIFMIKNPAEMFAGSAGSLTEMILARQKDESGLLELELRLDLRTHSAIQPAFKNSLVKSLIGPSYDPVPILKIFGPEARSVYAVIGPNVILEETIAKKQVSKVQITNDAFKHTYSVVLSEEHKDPADISPIKTGHMQYQHRYTVMSLSRFWRVDIIEYGQGDTVAKAKINYEQNPATRVDIEYDPGCFFKDIAKWSADSGSRLVPIIQKVGIQKIVPSAVDKVVKTLNTVDPSVVIKELGSVICKILRILDSPGTGYRAKPAESRQVSKFQRMKNFHNSVKLNMVMEASRRFENPRLLDVSVGRGGDIDKWISSGIKKVYAIDPDPTDIAEARSRFSKNPRKRGHEFTFEVAKITDANVKIPGLFQIVSCQFSLHYFFETSEMINNALRHISNSLVKGGVFIGTTLDHKQVLNMIRDNQWPDHVQMRQGSKPNEYFMRLIDTSTATYFKDMPEYLVDFAEFESLCNLYGLKLETKVSFASLKSGLQGFEAAVSRMYTAFVFVKRV